ncbi:hypothetical protein HDU86_001030 [Geranomyces michiganensis]|nr:hypothetical protein HDU86_001030 [Geranomyces michiganensis]
MSSAYGTLQAPRQSLQATAPLPLPLDITLKDSSLARITRYDAAADASLLAALRVMMNAEIAAGNTYPQEEEMTEQAFLQYFLSNEAFVVRRRKKRKEEDEENGKEEEEALGMFYIKPNFPGRCSHVMYPSAFSAVRFFLESQAKPFKGEGGDGGVDSICNGGFIVTSNARGLGVGRAMGEAFLTLVPLLGYRAAMFNLVFKTNVPSVNLWKSLGFETIGVIPKAGRLLIDGKEEYVDALTMYYDFCK